MFSFSKPVVLVGGGACASDILLTLVELGYPLIAADGGANHFEQLSVMPELIVGDLDSLSRQSYWQASTRVIKLEEQDTTDFEKCLYTVDAPLYIAVGFTGKRLDHTLSALHVIAKYANQKRVVLVGEDDIVFVCRGAQQFALSEGLRFSIYPLETVSFLQSTGLLYPLDGLTLSPTTMIGTSNEVRYTQERQLVTLETEPHCGDRDGAYAVILPVTALSDVLEPMIDGF